jgi:hypothetical protein
MEEIMHGLIDEGDIENKIQSGNVAARANISGSTHKILRKLSYALVYPQQFHGLLYGHMTFCVDHTTLISW